jgi:hypothetical protein
MSPLCAGRHVGQWGKLRHVGALQRALCQKAGDRSGLLGAVALHDEARSP